MLFEKLKYIREENELTQEQMAKILNVKRSAYSLWEINKNIIPLPKLIDFSNYFSLNLDYISGLTDNKKYNDLINKQVDSKEIGKRFKIIRKELKFTQDKLAQKLGTTHSAISAYENGKTLIPTIFLFEFSKITNISMDYLTGKSKNKYIKKMY